MKPLLLALMALASSPSAFAGVIVLDETGAGDFTTIDAALAAATSGDVVLVKSGDYTLAGTWPPAPIPLPNMDLSIVADQGATVVIANELQVTGLSANHRVVISGLSLQSNYSGLGAALRLEDCLGAVRVQDSILGTFGDRAAIVINCEDVVFTRLNLSSGHGPSISIFGDGGHGYESLLINNSQLAAYDSHFTGGDGEDAFWGGIFCGANGGDGGAGVRAVNGSFFYAMGCEFEGGDGGLKICEGLDGLGDVGLLVNASEANLAQPVFIPGSSPNGTVAEPFAGDVINNLLEIRRELQGPVVVREGQPYAWKFIGRPGDRVFLPSSPNPNWRWLPPLGPLTLASPISVGGQMGILNSGTSIIVNVTAPTLPMGIDSQLIHQQFFALKADGKRLLGTAHTQYVLDSSF